MNCSLDEDIACLVEGKLSPVRRAEIFQHIASCESCLQGYLFLLKLKDMDAAGELEIPGFKDDEGIGLEKAATLGIAGLGALIVPFFESQNHDVIPDRLVAGHEKYFDNDERNTHHLDTDNHRETNSNDFSMTNNIHQAPRQLGPEGSEEKSFDVHQHYNDTCAIRSQQLILRDYGINLTQEELIKEATLKGWYHSGTHTMDIGNLLESHGVAVNRVVNANEYNLFHELAQGHEVIAAVNSNQLWHSNNLEGLEYSIFGGDADHALIIAGINTRDENHTTVIIKDPGTGQIAKEYPMDQFMNAWKGSHCFMVTTENPAPFNLPQMAHFDYGLGHITQVGPYSYDDFHHHFATQFEPYLEHPATVTEHPYDAWHENDPFVYDDHSSAQAEGVAGSPAHPGLDQQHLYYNHAGLHDTETGQDQHFYPGEHDDDPHHGNHHTHNPMQTEGDDMIPDHDPSNSG